MPTEPAYLLDQLETSDMLEIDGLHASHFLLNDALLDEAEAAAEAGLPFESEATVLSIEAQDGRNLKRWQFTYNQVMEAEYLEDENSWLVGDHRITCYEAVGAESEDE
ncbi:DUF5629 family protein [Pseudomonas sp. Marseille-QA0892]